MEISMQTPWKDAVVAFTQTWKTISFHFSFLMGLSLHEPFTMILQVHAFKNYKTGPSPSITGLLKWADDAHRPPFPLFILADCKNFPTFFPTLCLLLALAHVWPSRRCQSRCELGQ